MHILIAYVLLGLAACLGSRSVNDALQSVSYYSAVTNRESPTASVNAGLGFLVEGFTLGILPAGSHAEAVTLAVRSMASMYQEDAAAAALGMAVALAWALGFAALAGRSGSMRRRQALRVALGASFLCLAVGVTAPIMMFKAYANVPLLGWAIVEYDAPSVLSTASNLAGTGKGAVAALVVVFSVLTPIAKLLLSLAVLQSASQKACKAAHRIVAAIGKWSMADVFVVAILIAVYSHRDGGEERFAMESEVGMGLGFFVGHSLLSLVISHYLRVREIGSGVTQDVPRKAIGAPVALLALCVSAVLPALVPQATERKDNFVVPVNSAKAVSFRVGSAPRRLRAQWHSSGREHGGMDDLIVHALLVGPRGEVHQIWDHVSDGGSEVQVEKPGIYSLVFNNRGILRSTHRSVTCSLSIEPR